MKKNKKQQKEFTNFNENLTEEEKLERIQKAKKRKKLFDLPCFKINEDKSILSIGVKVPDKSKETLETALRIFKQKTKDSGILDEYKERGEYVKPSVKRRKQKLSAIRRENRE